MISFVTMADAMHSHNVVNSKEEMLELISKLYDRCVTDGCTYFDLVVNTDGKKES